VLIANWIAACSANQIHYIPLIAYYLPYIRLPKMPNQHIFIMKMATALFDEMLDNLKHFTWLIPES
jgi:hypothetical protein